MENIELKKVRIKNRMCYYFDNIVKLEDFDIDNNLKDEKSHKNNQVITIQIKLWLKQNLC